MIEERRKNSYNHLKNFFIFDIETVKDDDMFDSIATEKEIEKDKNGEFLPVPFHRIVSVSVMIIKDKEIKHFRTISTSNENEALKFFWLNYKEAFDFEKKVDHRDGVKKLHISSFPVLVSINGKSFDIPVITVRTLKHISSIEDKLRKFISIHLDKFDNWEKEYPKYTYKYSRFHIDIPEDIFGRKLSLKNLCYLCNIPVKQEGKGEEVAEMFRNGDKKKIALYCSEDVLATAKLFAYINEHLLYNSYNFPESRQLDGIEPEIIILD